MRGDGAQGPAKSENGILRSAFNACRRHIGYVILFSFCLNLLYLAPSIYMLQVYDRVMTSGGVLTLIYLSLVLVAALGVLSFLDATRTRILATMARRFDRLIAPHVLRASLQREGKRAAGNAHVIREFDALRGAISGQPALAAIDAPWTPLYILICFMIHPWIGTLAIVGGALLVGVAFINYRSMKAALKDNEKATGALYGLQLNDSSQGDTAKALGMWGSLVRRQMRAREAMSRSLNESSQSGAVYASSTKFLRLVLQSASLGLGAYLAIHGDISAGGVIAASILTSRAFAPLELIVGAWRQFEQGRQAYKIISEVLATQEETRNYTLLPDPKGQLSVENAVVRSPNSDRFLLAGANFRVEAGEIVGILGPSGAGKTTLVRVITGAQPLDQGAVRLDGAKLTDWDPDRLGPHIGYLPQELGLFAGSIKDNICRFQTGDAEEIDRAVIEAAKQAGVHELILTLPQGYDSEIGAGGRGLSTGQAQRVALARALYGNPVLIALDEPNAHLDQEGEAALVNALKAARARGATIMVVAHRAGFMNIADKLMVVNNGRVEGFGPRDMVLQKLNAGGGPRPVVVSSTEPARPT
ncbi:type I secretion system permease/ATPase [Terricaulis sp.]|uniref:type I secretion system permease/ATPase n=1 Tax=Terricaulis sp. TaxID=2768686 RepID=UPI003783027F